MKKSPPYASNQQRNSSPKLKKPLDGITGLPWRDMSRAPGKNQEKKLTFFRQNSSIRIKAGF